MSINKATPVVINSPKKIRSVKGAYKVAAILPDPQIGYRDLSTGLNPFHDEKAMDVALQIIGYLEEHDRVDTVVNLGDFLDLPAQGRFEQEPAFAFTTQHAINRGHKFLQQQRAVAGPRAKLVLIEGNHDKRMEKFIMNNAASTLGLKKANMPDSMPVMSLPYLLRLDEIGVEYIDAYPAGAYWLNDKLRAVHGSKVRSGGSTAAAYTNDSPHISTIFGHVHRQELQSKTVFDRLGPIKSVAVSPGCLCRVDGAVPSVNGATKIDGSPAVYYENWQQGMAVIMYKPSGEFYTELVQIDNGRAVFRGREFTSKL
jgi:predicted phosphodiesterase